MNASIRTRIAQFAAIALALFAGSAVAAALAQPPTSGEPSRALVVAGPAADDPAVVARIKAVAERTHTPLRVTHRSADQLGATHLFAALDYDTVITIGVDRRTAIAPVAERYPHTRFVATDSNQLDAELSR